MAKLLFIDDDPEIRNLYGSFLQRRLHCLSTSRYNRNSVTLCENGPQAIALLQKELNFNLIICDYAMPIKNGADVWAYVQEFYPVIPFILFTSQKLEELPEFGDSFRRSGNVWLQKPASPEKLLQVVHSLLSEESAGLFMA
ncbi:MAG: response regulator [Bdellovibrio sp.]|nr:response regulator [Bdellovibrio sp.]